jgi:deoxyadenosine/deoxycytidine kinase
MTAPTSTELLWDCRDLPRAERRGFYVAISGNTSGGKSSIIKAVEDKARALGLDLIGVSERSFHHPYLPLMFSNPKEFAFPIQVQFMLQRHLVLKRQLSLGRTVVIERSHLDDELFVLEHVQSGAITQVELDAYRGLAAAFHSRLPVPDVIVILNPPPEVSLSRLRKAEASGERPCEFPNPEAQKQWVYRWHDLYNEFHRNLRGRVATESQFASTQLVELGSEVSPGEASDRLIERLVRRAAA